MLAARITLAHFSVSSATSLPNSAGASAVAVPPKSAKRALILGSARAAAISLLSRSMISGGVFLGAPTPSQSPASKPGTNSFTVGTSGSASARAAVVTARARSRPVLIYSIAPAIPAEEIGQCGACAAIRHVNKIDAGRYLEKFAHQMAGRTDAGRCHCDLARIGLGVGDQLGHGFGRDLRIGQHDLRLPDQARDRRDVAEKHEAELVVKCRVDRARWADHQERMAVGRRAHDRFGCDIGARARPVLDDEWLAEPLLQPLSDQARADVGRAASGETDDNAHLPRRVGLCLCKARDHLERGS